MIDSIRILLLVGLFLLGLASSVTAQDAASEYSDSSHVDSLWPGWISPSQSIDTSAASSGARAWFLTLGVILTTGAAVFLLFSVRSR